MDRRLGCTRAMRPSTRCSACASASSAACSRTVSIAHCKNTSSACVPTLLGLVGVRRSVRCSAQCAGHGLGEWYNNTMAQAWLIHIPGCTGLGVGKHLVGGISAPAPAKPDLFEWVCRQSSYRVLRRDGYWQQQREEGCQRGSSPSESSGQRDSMPRHSLYDRGTRYRPLRASGSAWGDAERVAGWAEPGVVSAGCSSTAVASTLSSMSASVTVASASASLAPVVPAEGASINTAAGPVSTSLRGGHTRAAPAY
jgi:hypothetical protein